MCGIAVLANIRVLKNTSHSCTCNASRKLCAGHGKGVMCCALVFEDLPACLVSTRLCAGRVINLLT